jgi:hypothetical protein
MTDALTSPTQAGDVSRTVGGENRRLGYLSSSPIASWPLSTAWSICSR